MVEDWVGTAAFQRGIRRYLREHAMGNATTGELEKDIEEETGVKVTPVMDGMLNRVGYPVLRFNLETGKLVVDEEQAAGGAPWAVPVCIHLERAKRMCEVLSTAHAEIPLEGASTGVEGSSQTWTWTNEYGSGYYRSVLGAGMLDALVGRGYQELSEPERLSVLIDIKAGAR